VLVVCKFFPFSENPVDQLLFIQVPPRGTAQQSGKKVQCYEPATMKYLGFLPALTPDEVCEPRLMASQETYDCDA